MGGVDALDLFVAAWLRICWRSGLRIDGGGREAVREDEIFPLWMTYTVQKSGTPFVILPGMSFTLNLSSNIIWKFIPIELIWGEKLKERDGWSISPENTAFCWSSKNQNINSGLLYKFTNCSSHICIIYNNIIAMYLITKLLTLILWFRIDLTLINCW